MRNQINYADLRGSVFGRLTVCEVVGRNKRYEMVLGCACTCGGSVSVPYPRLKSGNTKSCGCLQPQVASQNGLRRATHGGCYSPTYSTYRAMLKRCYDPNSISYKTHGGRGISVCDRWRGEHGYANFRADVGERPPGTSLDRYPDNNGNYQPGNVRWATREQQARNTRTNRLITIDGETKILKDWATEKGVSSQTILDRINRGWSEFDAVMRPRRGLK